MDTSSNDISSIPTSFKNSDLSETSKPSFGTPHQPSTTIPHLSSTPHSPTITNLSSNPHPSTTTNTPTHSPLTPPELWMSYQNRSSGRSIQTLLAKYGLKCCLDITW